jgi:arylsulfatase A-like enzyme
MKFLLKDSLRWLRAGVLAFGLGLIAGSFEAVEIAFNLHLALTFGEALGLAVTASLFGGLLGAGLGVGVGVPLHLVGRRLYSFRWYSLAASISAFFISGFFLWQAALNLVGDGRMPAALAMAACPIGVAGVIWFNASYWARREEYGTTPKLGWTLVSPLIAFGICLVAAGIGSAKESGSSRALSGDPNVLLITIDTLRRDHVSAYGEGLAQTPRMDALAEEGILFLNAVTPTPETAPAHTSMMTALHPLRHHVISNGHKLTEGYTTLAELLQKEGYATGAFLSSFAVNSRTGLSQGFEVYEDDFVPFVRGFSSILLARRLLSVLMVVGNPHDFPWLLERKGHETNRLASDWIRERGDKPWFAWVHYFEPHAPYEGPDATVDHRDFLDEADPTYTEAEAAELRRLYAYEVGLADTQVGELLDLLDELEIDDRTLVIVTADHGEQLGEHGIYFHHHNLYDESLQIPLIIRAPGLRGGKLKRIPQQVRLMDIAPTVLKWLKLGVEMEPSEGVPLLEYATAQRERSLPSTLFGRRTASLSEGTLFGMRAPADLGEEEVHIKYIVDPATGAEELYNLAEDPDEQDDIGPAQEEMLKSLRPLVAREMGAATGLAADVNDAEIEALKAMGYME